LFPALSNMGLGGLLPLRVLAEYAVLWLGMCGYLALESAVSFLSRADLKETSSLECV
jgi:hypothetical protein